MHRRHLCKASLVGVATPLSGCLGRFDGGSSDGAETPEPVTEADFEFSDGSDEHSQDDPTIEVNVEEESATVTETLRVGSGSCNEAILDEIASDDGSTR